MHVQTEPKPERCVWAGCHDTAVGQWEFQWTLVDSIEYPACEDHRLEVGQVGALQLVDGYPPSEITWVRWSLQ